MSSNTTTANPVISCVNKLQRVLDLYTVEQRAYITSYINRIKLDKPIGDDELRCKLIIMKEEDKDAVRACFDRLEDETDGVDTQLKYVLECMTPSHREEIKCNIGKISEN